MDFSKAFPWRQSICRTIMASSPFYASINNGFFNRWKFVDDGDDGHCTPWESSERRGRLKMVGFGCYIQEDYAASGHYHFEPMAFCYPLRILIFSMFCESEMEQCSTAVVWTEWKKHCLSSRECLQEGTCNNNICGAPTPST